MIKWCALYIGLSFLLACSSRSPKVPTTTTPIPKALEEQGDFSIATSRYSDNVVEELWKEVTAKNPPLQQWEAGRETLQEQQLSPFKGFATYSNNIENYYKAASRLAGSIGDSLLKRRMENLLAESKKKQEAKAGGVANLVHSIHTQDSVLQALHAALKIAYTLPIIEGYEANQLPSTAPFQQILQKQQGLKQQADSLLPR